MPDTPASPPTAKQAPHTVSHHGVTLNDEYAWLRAENWQEVMREPDKLATDIRDYLEAENAYMQATLADTDALQKILFEEMKGRIKEDDSSVPSPDGDWDYYSSYVTGAQYPRLCRRPRNDDSEGAERVLLDGNVEAEGLAYFSLGAVDHSPDHKLLAYATDTKGSELYTVRVRDLETGEDLDDEIPNTGGGLVWAKDNRTLFYVRLDANHRPQHIYRHTLGTSVDDDVLVYEETDPGFYTGVGETQSGQFIVIGSNDHQTSEVRIIDAGDPTSEPRLISQREHGHEYSVEHHDERLIILTNTGDAEDFKIVEAPLDNPARDNWREIEAHKAGRLILNVTVLQNHMVRLEREDGLPRIIVRRLDDGDEHSIAFDEEAYALGMSAGYEFDTTTLRYSYASMTTPAQVYDYDMETRERVLRKTQEVPSGHDIADYRTRRIQAPAHDGETIPVSLLYHKDTALDGSAPLLLYGYGSYGMSMPASFSTTRLSLVDRGFVYAIAHIRGGKDKGYRWYTEGKLAKKTNTFKDFISAGEHLAATNYTTRGQIIGHGGSAGGMLMGAVANMAPDLFLGIIANVPFVDVLNTMLDDTLPLTPPEWLEWGNPIASAEEFATIRSYSPYDNVAAQNYPHILALAGLTDPRVTYWEPAKWVARLRASKTDTNLLLLKTNMDAGHAGASGRFDSLKEVALEYAFALKIAGRADLENAI